MIRLRGKRCLSPHAAHGLAQCFAAGFVGPHAPHGLLLSSGFVGLERRIRVHRLSAGGAHMGGGADPTKNCFGPGVL